MAETGESKKLTYLEVLVDGQKKHGCDSKESAVESRPWPNLPLDILRSILERCSLVEQIRLYAVCKSWHDHAPSVDRLPWLMTYDWSEKLGNYLKSNCNFSGPARDQTCNLDQIIYGQGRSDFIGADILALKRGWLLLKNGDRPFLYNPFRRQIMNLPSLDIGSGKATLSTVPTSPNCVIFVIKSSNSGDKIMISTYNCGDSEWTSYNFDGFSSYAKDVVYVKGKFYCVFSNGMLGVFEAAQHDWSVLTQPQLPRLLEFLPKYEFHMVESEGEFVLLVCLGRPQHFFRFDWLRMEWVRIKRLGNRAVFIDKTSYAVSVEGELARNLAERIYYHGDKYTWFYSLEAGSYAPCSKLYTMDVGVGHKRVWIEPCH